jgi:hypothetical protein
MRVHYERDEVIHHKEEEVTVRGHAMRRTKSQCTAVI